MLYALGGVVSLFFLFYNLIYYFSMNGRKLALRFKTGFKNLNFYSMPLSILFIVRKRLNFVFLSLLLFLVIFFSTL